MVAQHPGKNHYDVGQPQGIAPTGALRHRGNNTTHKILLKRIELNKKLNPNSK